MGVVIAGLAAGAMFHLSGCGKEEEKTVVDDAPPPPPPPPEQPKAVDLFKQYNIDSRIEIAQDEIPIDDQNPELATKKLVAVLKFFDAMVRGSDERLRPMLASADQKVLAEIVQGGLFKPAADGVTRVVLGCGGFQLGFESADAVFALVQSGPKFEAQLWTYTLDDAGNATFDAAPTPPDILDKLQGTKSGPRIRQWAQAIKDRLEEAKKPDEIIVMPSVDYGIKKPEGEESDGGGGGSPATPVREDPGGPGKRPIQPGGVPAPRPPSPG